MTKIELALVELAKWTRALREINAKIHECICLSMENEPHNASALSGHKSDGKSFWLYMAYLRAADHDGCYYVDHEGDVEEYLEENCKHALKAHQLIQERRPIKAALGVAKRRVTFYANRLLAETES
jgi:hypothetical protein